MYPVLVVYKKSQLQLALEKRNTRIRRLLKSGDPSVAAMQAAHDEHEATLAEVDRALRATGARVTRVYRAHLRASMVRDRLVVTVGGDGTLLDASHKIGAATVLGVNSDRNHSVGFLCAGHRDNFASLLDGVLSKKLKPTAIPRMGGTIDEQPLPFPVLNDVLMTHKNPAATSRYLITWRKKTEDHKSSGLWASTGAGSSAAMASAGGALVDIDDPRVQLRVREPFVADGPPLQLADLWLSPRDEVAIVSKMREGRLYLDGPHQMCPLPMGARLVLHGRAPPLSLVCTPQMKARRNTAKR